MPFKIMLLNGCKSKGIFLLKKNILRGEGNVRHYAKSRERQQKFF